MENDGHEEEQIYGRTNHRLSQAGRCGNAGLPPVHRLNSNSKTNASFGVKGLAQWTRAGTDLMHVRKIIEKSRRPKRFQCIIALGIGQMSFSRRLALSSF